MKKLRYGMVGGGPGSFIGDAHRRAINLDGQAELVAGFWMPNRSWKGCDVDDPSARVLSNYGASGQ